ncbi:TetR family transcriptional regulator [Mycobacterium sp. GA-1999]|nr:TetR family transcriptional regulator [Mycobacterium sp. GA-1999]KUH91730.1 TetR family transcriptional regulator [Mycobacterium sp. GA-0227b]KUH96554.1 TetR family transcriptional regulator [Mycobacterium sp. IS-1556]
METVASDPLIGIVVELLDTEGYEAVQLREVARRARMSLSTIYKRYRTRDELIIAALEWWLTANRYADLAPADDATLYGGLMHIFRTVFEPWETHPQLLKSYFRALSGPGGDRLTKLGIDAVTPPARDVLAHADPQFAQDLERILTSLVYGVLGQLASDAIDVTDVVPSIERAVFWLVDGRS